MSFHGRPSAIRRGTSPVRGRRVGAAPRRGDGPGAAAASLADRFAYSRSTPDDQLGTDLREPTAALRPDRGLRAEYGDAAADLLEEAGEAVERLPDSSRPSSPEVALVGADGERREDRDDHGGAEQRQPIRR